MALMEQLEADAQNCCLKYLLTTAGLPSPCFVLDEDRLLENAAILADTQKESGAKILLALKGFAAWHVFPLLSAAFAGPLQGVCASSVDEAQLGKEKFGGEVHAFAAAWSDAEMHELLRYADHITFNSVNQWRKFEPIIAAANLNERKGDPVTCGFRVNPEHSEGAPAIYNPCSPGSRLGIRKNALPQTQDPIWHNLSGLHFHTLCEQNADALARTLESFEENFNPWIQQAKWFNFGGGHHITRKDYDRKLLVRLLREWQTRHPGQIYLEPGEAVALNAGWLLTTVLDVIEADMPVVILDCSAACHMPDVLEMPYKPEVWYKLDKASAHAEEPGKEFWTCRLAGKSCLAGDVIGEYSFAKKMMPGDRIIFSDMAIYSMVKTTTFNGLRLPSIASFSCNEGFTIVRSFVYEDFKNRLS